MIKIENLTYSFPEKDLYKNVSFTLKSADFASCSNRIKFS